MSLWRVFILIVSNYNFSIMVIVYKGNRTSKETISSILSIFFLVPLESGKVANKLREKCKIPFTEA